MSQEGPSDPLGEMIALVVHDLRNPVATISANLSFVRDVAGVEDPDALEALDDVEIALADLTRGLEQLSWVGRWMGGTPAADAAPGDVRQSVEQGVRRSGSDVAIELPDAPIEMRCAGQALTRLVELLVRNATSHAKPDSVRVSVSAEGSGATIEVRDGGSAVGHDLRPHIFTAEGQQLAKGRIDGRYSRVVGLLAARALADAIGAELAAGGEDGAAVFTVRLPG
ncbi:MAG: sensor histidine kinase [Sandaracinaceae bacterium]